MVTLFQNEQVSDLLMYIRVLYSLLRPGGLWIDCSTSAFEQLPGCLSYREY